MTGYKPHRCNNRCRHRCDNVDCADCWPDEEPPVKAWWWPWAVAFLVALAAALGVVIQSPP